MAAQIAAAVVLFGLLGIGIVYWMNTNEAGVPVSSSSVASIPMSSSASEADTPAPADSVQEDASSAASNGKLMPVVDLAPQWDEADAFSKEGLARVRVGDQWGVINKVGKYVVRPIYDQIGYFSEERAVVIKDMRCGVVDATGREIVKPVYDQVMDFKDGMTVVVKGQQYSFMDRDGNLIEVPGISKARPFTQGVAPVKQGRDSWVYIDQSTHAEVYALQAEEAYSFSNDMARFQIGGLWGFYNRDFELVISARYDEAQPFDENGFAIVTEDGKQFLIDKEGRRVTRDYTKIWPFSNGFATVQDGDSYGYLDESGDEVIPTQFPDVYSFGNGLCPVEMDNGQWGYIDEQGEVALLPEWDEAFKFFDGFARVCRNGRYGLIDTNGEIIIEVNQEDIGWCSNELIAFKEDGMWGYYRLDS